MKLLILIAFLGSLLLAAIFGTLSIVQRKDSRKLKRNLIITALSAIAFIAIFFWIGTYSGESNRSAASSSYSKAESSKVESSQDDDDSYEDTDSDDSDDEESSSTETFNAADYNTGITYEQLARTPNDYKGKNITLTGKVIQVVEGDDETDLRVAVDGNYDNVIMVGYDPDIMNGSRILENDKITFYAESLGTTTYKSTMGGKITVPLALAKKIDDAGTAPDDYGDQSLEWCTRSENNNYGAHTQRSALTQRTTGHCGKPVIIISPSGIAYRFVSQSEAARFIGVASSDVNAAVLGKQQKVRGYKIFEDKQLLEGKQ